MSVALQEVHSAEPSIEELVVPVDSEVFRGHEEAAFYIGILSVHNVVLMPKEYQAATRLRANVYIDEHGFLQPEDRKRDGGEEDIDDRRSIQFGIIENRGEDKPRMMATARLIVKEREGELLPVEKHFPEAFEDESAPINSAEVSRFIARHESRFTQRAMSLALIRAMTACTVENFNQPVYGIVESHLARLLKSINLPYDVIADPKMVTDYNTENMAIEIDPTLVVESVKPENHLNGAIGQEVMQMFFGQTMEHRGLGYFNETLTEVVK